MKPAPGLAARGPIMGAGLPPAYPPANPRPRRSSSTPTIGTAAAHRAASIPNGHCCHPTPARVSGSGYQAKAALVDALLDEGQLEAAGEVARCSSFILRGQRHLTLHEGEGGRRHLGGLNHCERIVCPVCGPYLMATRLDALKPVVARAAHDEGLRFFFVVLTLRHRSGAGFRDLVKVLRACQRSLVQARRWKDTIRGWIRVLESTYGQNGHHPHENLILAAPSGLEAEGFFAWIQTKFAEIAQKHGRTAQWADGWWREIPREELQIVLSYMGTKAKMEGTPVALREIPGALREIPSALREILGSAHKHQPIWCIPPKAFAEVWMDSKGLRWFGTGGIFKGTEADKSDEELGEDRENQASVIAHVPGEVFSAWTPAEKRDRLAVMLDRTLTREQVVTYILACGGAAGPPQELDAP